METITHEQFKFFIEQINEAGKRNRILIYLLAIASIVTWVTFLNSKNGSWIRSRYETLTLVKNEVENQIINTVGGRDSIGCESCERLNLESLATQNFQIDSDFLEKIISDRYITDSLTAKITRALNKVDSTKATLFNEKIEKADSLEEKEKAILETRIDTFTRIGVDSVKGYYTKLKIKEYLSSRKGKIKNYGDLRSDYEIHAALYRDMLQINVPFLGLTFDWNYIPVFSGLSFILIYLVLIGGLRRENENIGVLKKMCSEQMMWPLTPEHGFNYYSLLAISPITSVDSSKNGFIRSLNFVNLGVFSIFILPLIIYFFWIYGYSFVNPDTVKRAESANLELFLSSRIWCSIFLGLIFMLMIVCCFEYYKSLHLWKAFFQPKQRNPEHEGFEVDGLKFKIRIKTEGLSNTIKKSASATHVQGNEYNIELKPRKRP